MAETAVPVAGAVLGGAALGSVALPIIVALSIAAAGGAAAVLAYAGIRWEVVTSSENYKNWRTCVTIGMLYQIVRQYAEHHDKAYFGENGLVNPVTDTIYPSTIGDRKKVQQIYQRFIHLVDHLLTFNGNKEPTYTYGEEIYQGTPVKEEFLRDKFLLLKTCFQQWSQQK